MKGIQVRRGAILLWRLGQLSYGEQSAWDRAPARRGMWAFPWPYYDASFTEHQYNYYMPKHLQLDKWGWPVDDSVLAYADGTKPAEVVLDEDGYPEDPYLTVPASFWDDRNAWIETLGRRVLPLRKFWYEGEVLTHIPARGVSRVDPWDLLDTWHPVHSSELAPRLNKASGQLRPVRTGRARMLRSDAGPLELFLTPGAGRIS